MAAPKPIKDRKKVKVGQNPKTFLEKVKEIGEKQGDKNIKSFHTRLIGTSSMTSRNTRSFIANIEKNRFPVPIFDNKRVKLSSDVKATKDYLPGTYVSYNREDYIIVQAPGMENVMNFWRMIWQDGCKIIVCVVELSMLSTDEGKDKCYQYWPLSKEAPLQIADRYQISLTKKKEEKDYVIYDLQLSLADRTTSVREPEPGKPEEEWPPIINEDQSKPRDVILLHFTNWSADKWPNIDNLAHFVKLLAAKQIQIVKAAKDDYVPPVVIQGYVGLNRVAVVWVTLILMKQITLRESFDLHILVRKLIRLRPGAFSDPLALFITFALGFRLAALGGWSSLEDARKRINEIKEGYEKKMNKTERTTKT